MVSQIVPNNWFRAGPEMKNNPTMVPVVAVALLDGQGCVLMQQRRHGAAHGGLWEFPGGKVEPAETLDQALVREIREELGIALDPAALEPLSFAALPGERHVVLLYSCREWHGEPRCLEGEGIAWVSADALLALDMPPLDVPLAGLVKELINKRN